MKKTDKLQFPKSIKISSFDYDLQVVEEKIKMQASETKALKEGEEDYEMTLMGCINDSEQIIKISTCYHPQQQVATLLHEIVHGLVTCNHIPVPDDYEAMEITVDMIANSFYQVLKDNPQLLKLFN